MAAKGPQLNPGDPIVGTKYRVVKSLGAGGMGVVYQVVKPPNIQGVLKLMSTELTRHQEHRMRFFDEVRILAQLDHPNIVRVFDYDALPDGTPFYVMEVLSGRTVRDVIATMGRVPPRVAYEITRQLLEALQAAHTHEVPVIHRDIKPENIFLHAPRHGEPVVKLIDFGVSSVADRKHDGSFVGTWAYAAPEQIRGEPPTPATDLYAAGLVLYEMLAGVGPFDHHEDWGAVSKAQMHEVPAPVSTFAPWVPESIVSLIQSALAKDPRVRPRDAYAFAERLYELEWASDGNDPHDLTTEGRDSEEILRRVNAHRKADASPGMPPRGHVEVSGAGPLSRVLSTITLGKASSKNLAAAKPATDRLGDVPLIGVPPESVCAGPTWKGVGPRHTAPDAEVLLSGLGPPTAVSSSPSSRGSNPDPDVPLAATRVEAVAAPARTEKVADRPLSPSARAGAAAITLDERSAPAPNPAPAAYGATSPTRDTFSSQQSDARRPPMRSRAGLAWLAAALFVGGFVIALVVVLQGRTVQAGATNETDVKAAANASGSAPPLGGYEETVSTNVADDAVPSPETAAVTNGAETRLPTAEDGPKGRSVPTTEAERKIAPTRKTTLTSAAAAKAAPSVTATASAPSSAATASSAPSSAPSKRIDEDLIRHF